MVLQLGPEKLDTLLTCTLDLLNFHLDLNDLAKAATPFLILRFPKV